MASARPTLQDKAAPVRHHLAGGLSLSRFAEAAQSAGSQLDVDAVGVERRGGGIRGLHQGE